MRGWSVIYCDGRDLTVSAGAADELRRRGLIVPHLGAGHDGITGGDWTLAEAVAWSEVDALVDSRGDLRASPEGRRTASLWRQDAKP